MYDRAKKYNTDLMQKKATITKPKTNNTSLPEFTSNLVAALDKNEGKLSTLGSEAKLINGFNKPILMASKREEAVKHSNKNISFIFEPEITYKTLDKYLNIFYLSLQSASIF